MRVDWIHLAQDSKQRHCNMNIRLSQNLLREQTGTKAYEDTRTLDYMKVKPESE